MKGWIEEVLQEKNCEYCGKALLWVKTTKGYIVPVDKDTLEPHRLSCPKAHLWSKKAARKKRNTTTIPRKPLQEYLDQDTLR